MPRKSLWLIVALVSLCPTYGYDDRQFEVASLKITQSATGPDRFLPCVGGPGTSKPATWTCPHISLDTFFFMVYDLELYQFQGPEWLNTIWLEIAAKVPPGASKEQLRRMQQNLLEERFKPVFHWQTKEMTVYDLRVAKSGFKMHESAPDAPEPQITFGLVPGATVGADHYPVFPAGKQGLMGVNGRRRWKSANVTMADIVKVLRREVRSDVFDATGLDGKYDIDIHWEGRPIEVSPSAPPFDGPDIEKALEGLGLRVEPRKGAARILVLDHIQKVPEPN